MLGIVGGMGPAAGINFCQKLLDIEVKKDQEHIPFILVNQPNIPDRTKTILSKDVIKENNLYSHLLEIMEDLVYCDCDKIVMICNTAHYYIKELQSHIEVPIIDMIQETVNTIGEERVGLLATNGTIQSKLYDRYINNLIIPDDKYQKKIMRAIYSIKKGNLSGHNLPDIKEHLREKGAKYIILGCTELSLIDDGYLTYDPVEILAQKIKDEHRNSN